MSNNKELNIELVNLIRSIRIKKDKGENCDLEVTTIILSLEKVIDIVMNSNFYLDGLKMYTDDIKQEGRLGIVNAINTYDLDSDVTFLTYVSKCIKNKMIDFIVKQEKITNNNMMDDFDNNCRKIIDEDLSTVDDVLIAKEFVEKLKKNLSDVDFSIIEYYSQGYSYEQIANKLKITNKDVDNSIQKIKRKYK